MSRLLSDLFSFLYQPCFTTKPFFKRFHAFQSSRPPKPLAITSKTIVRQPSLYNAVSYSTEDKFWGVHVLASPPACGKSTYISQIMGEKLANKNIRLMYVPTINKIRKHGFANGLLRVNAPIRLPVPNLSVCDFNDLLAENNFDSRLMIVLDQVERIKDFPLQEKQAFYDCIFDLATESVRLNKFSVLVSCADAKISEEIVMLNKREKIKYCDTPSSFKWDYANSKELLDLLESYKGRIDPALREYILNLTSEAQTAGFVVFAYEEACKLERKNRSNIEISIKKFAADRKVEWEAFENLW